MNGTNVSDETIQWELRLRPFPFACYLFSHSIVVVMIIFGNLVVILTVFGSKFEKTSNTMIMGSLAVADMLTGFIAVPSSLFARVVVSQFTCEAFPRQMLFMPAFVYSAISVAHLIVLSVDRYIAVSSPLKHPLIMTPGKVKRILFFVWVIGILIGVTPMLGSLNSPNQWVCGTVNYESGAVRIHSLMPAFAAPAICMTLLVFYIRIFSIAKKHMKETSKRRLAGMDETTVKKLESKSRINATVTAVLVVAALGICWFPLSAKNVVEYYLEPSERIQFIYQTATEFFVFFNSAVNPLIYASRNKKYRDTARRILRIVCPMLRKSEMAKNNSKHSKNHT